MQVLMGYTHLSGIPLCPCKDPGNYASLECHDPSKPLECVLRCFCGSVAKVKFDDIKERVMFIDNKGV